MDLHCLKVVKFDRSLEKLSNPTAIIGDVAKETRYTLINECEKNTLKNRKKHTDFKDNNGDLNIRRPFFIHKCESEPLKVTLKEKNLTKHKRRKTISFDEIKKNFTYKHNLFKPMRLPQLKKKREFPKRNMEVKVLFSSQVPRLTKRNKNVKTKLGTIKERPNSSYDIFGFQNRKYSFDQSSKQYRCDNECVTKKLSKLQSKLNKISKLSQPKSKPKPLTERQPLKFLKTQSSKLRVTKSKPRCCACGHHYNLVRFPENSNSLLRRKTSVGLKNIPVYPSGYFRERAFKDQQISVTPSRLQVRKKSVGDAAVTTSFSLCENCIKPKSTNISSEPIRTLGRIPKPTLRARNVCPCFGTTKKIFPYTLLSHREKKIRSLFKWILFILVVIAWIPCIITVPLCWLLTYPLKPQFIKTSRCKNNQCPHKRTSLSLIMNGVRCLADKAAYSVKAMLSLLRSNDEENNLQCRQATCSSGYPDPKKKYTLFYSDNRGWRMKPIRAQELPVQKHDHRILQDTNLIPAQYIVKNNNILKHKCCGPKLHGLEQNAKHHTKKYHREKRKVHGQNTKNGNSPRIKKMNEGISLEYKITRRRMRSKSHPLPNNSYDIPSAECPSHLRNFLSVPLPLNSTAARSKQCECKGYRRKHKTKFTSHHFSNCCDLCSQRKRYKIISKSEKHKNLCSKANKHHSRCCDATHSKKNEAFFKRVWSLIGSSYGRLKRIVVEAEDVAWKEEIRCDTYLENKPCPWLYRRCPSVYPCIVVWYKCIKSTWKMVIYALSFCVWCPVMCGFYIFSELFWLCLK